MKIFNKRAKFDYQILEKVEAGIVLTGGEARAIRTGHVTLTGSFVKIINKEALLVNASVPIPGKKMYDPNSTRKLLLHKGQILDLLLKTRQKRLTLIPLSVYTTGHLIKLEIALAKSKREFEKKEALKKVDIQRDIERELGS
jgi:SsrA-binding protein